LNEETIQEVEKYLDYIKDQEESLVTMEHQKEEFKNTYFIDGENT
jgi:hypothetical protein